MTRNVRPWIGSEYAAGNLPLKILIVGDSHHGDVASENEMFTIETIQSYLVKTNPAFAFFTRIMATITRAPYWTVDREKFYQSVAFFNYVDGVAVNFSRERPSADQFSSSAANFQNSVDELNADIVFCCGSDVKYRVCNDITVRDFLTIEEQGIKADYTKIGGRLYFFSKHPSSGYSKHWADVFQKLAETEAFSDRLGEMRKTWINQLQP